MKTVSFYTLGCKVNTYETAAIAKKFKEAGYEILPYKEDLVADVYVINTCTVTNIGDKKSRQIIRRTIRKSPNSIVVVIGCYAQVSPDEIKEIDGVDIILGTQGRDKIISYIEEFQKNKKPFMKVDNILKQRQFERLDVDDFHSNTRAFLKIQEGCNNFCSFCIIPFARGKIRSRDYKDVLQQSQLLVDQGYKEIVLTGIHTAGYGEDLQDYNFARLLKDIVLNVKNLPRLRISSIEASQITQEVLDVFKHSKIIVDHLHIPIQSGCDATLKRMYRKYLTGYFENTINKLREISPDISITTDLIVGFPGESVDEFVQTYNFCKKIAFSEIHVFPYSKRKKTPAARMKEQVDENTKAARVAKMITLSDEMADKYAKKFENKVVDVLVESQDKEDKDYFIGYSGNYLKVKFKGLKDKKYLNEIVKVQIVKSGYPINIGNII